MRSNFTFFLILITTALSGQNNNTYQKLTDSLIKADKLEELLFYFNSELKTKTQDDTLLSWVGFAHMMNDDLDSAEIYYKQSLKINPNCFQCYLNLSRIYGFREDYITAFNFVEKGIAIDPHNADIYSLRANLKQFTNSKIGALIDYDKAIELDPDNAEHYLQRGLYNANQGYLLLAIADLNKAVELAPENYYCYFQRASIYYELNKPEPALTDINRSIELKPDEATLYLGRASIYNLKQEYKNAIADYSKAISLDPEDHLTYFYRAGSYYNLEDMEAACTDNLYLNSLIENGKITDPALITEVKGSIGDICVDSKPSYYYQRGVAFYNLKEYQKAIDIYNEGLKKFPENSMTLNFMGNAFMALGEYQKAFEKYEQSLKYKENILEEITINPRFAGASKETINNFYNASLALTYYSIAECKINMGSEDDALDAINIALDLLPNLIEFNIEGYYNLKGFILLIREEYENAVKEFDKCIQIDKYFTMAYVYRAIAKISSVEKVKYVANTINGIIVNQPLNINWVIPKKNELNSKETMLVSALNDCNTAIELQKDFGYAYYIRGQVKQMLGAGEFCLDLITAESLGLIVEQILIEDCVK